MHSEVGAEGAEHGQVDALEVGAENGQVGALEAKTGVGCTGLEIAVDTPAAGEGEVVGS